MSIEADMILESVSRLTVEELLAIRAKIDEQLGQQKKVEVLASIEPATSDGQVYKRTPEEIEAFLSSILTPEQLTRVGQTDFSKKQLVSKSASQMLIEDREDRF